MRDIIVIAGPNGAGKSTLAPALLRDTVHVLEYVNADTIAEGLAAFAPEDASFDAGRVMLGRLRELAEEKKSFAFETRPASRFYAGWLQELRQEADYRVNIVFLWLRSVDLAIARVDVRVKLGATQFRKTRSDGGSIEGQRISLNWTDRLLTPGDSLTPARLPLEKLRVILRLLVSGSLMHRYGKR